MRCSIFKDSLLFQTLLSLFALSLLEDRAQAVREVQGDGGGNWVPEPRDAAALTTARWCGIRREEEWKERPPGIRQSHPTKPCLPRTYIPPPSHFSPPQNVPVHQGPTLRMCQGRDLWDSANSAPRLVGWGHKQRAEGGVIWRDWDREGRLNGTVCKTHLNWRLFCYVLFFLGTCKGDGQEGGEVQFFPKVMNSRINHRGETQ